MGWDSLNQSLVSASYIGFNTAGIAQPLNVDVDAPTTPPGTIDLRGPGSHGLDLRQVTRQADRVRKRIANHFDVSSDMVYLGGSATETLEFFLRIAEELRSAETALTTNREYGSLEKVLRNENYFDDMTWPAGREGLYRVFERHLQTFLKTMLSRNHPKRFVMMSTRKSTSC